MPCFTGRREEIESAARSKESAKRLEFAPNDEVEGLRPFVDEFWATILGTSYATSFVSNESTLDSWEHYVGGRAELIDRVERVYGVDITPYYDESIPSALRKVRDGAKRKNRDLEKIAVSRRTFKESPTKESDIQKVMRAHKLPKWPDYSGCTCETYFLYIPVIIIFILGCFHRSLFPNAKWYIFIGIPLFFVLCYFIIETIFIILNKPIRARWEVKVGKVISRIWVRELAEGNMAEWILIAVPKIWSYSSFGTYTNFGYGWDAVILLNTQSSERFVVRGRWKKIKSFAEKINLHVLG